MPYKNRDEYDKTTDVSAETWAHIKKNHPHLPPITDITGVRREAFWRLPKGLEDVCVKTFLKDPRDAIMLSLILNILFTIVPLSILLFLYPSHWLGATTLAFKFFMWIQRFILMMHYAEHRQLFKQPYHKFGKYLLNFVMCPFLGIPPGFYRLHHVVMHHIENNVFEEDLSSTEPYQRDNFFHFLIYFYRYWTHLYFLPMYAIRKERYELAATAFFGSSVWFGSIFFGIKYYPIFTLYTLIIPALISGGALMFGNFSQHIFVHPDVATMPQDLKSNRFNCALTLQSINHIDNQYAFNDGYHITHHINSRIHWTDMPAEFLKDLDKYAENGAVVFDGLGFFDVGVNVMLGNWEKLYEHYVHLGKHKRSKEEVIKDLKYRLIPIKRDNKVTNVKSQ